MPIKLSPRLMTAVPYVRRGSLVADIGTDHAYLPIYLCEKKLLTPVTTPTGETLCAVAADINKGPVERADQHITEARLTPYIRTLQTDGLTGLQTYDPQETYEIMESLLGKQDNAQKPEEKREETGYNVPHS